MDQRRLPAPPASAAHLRRPSAPPAPLSRQPEPPARAASAARRITSSGALRHGGRIADRVVDQPTQKLALEVGREVLQRTPNFSCGGGIAA